MIFESCLIFFTKFFEVLCLITHVMTTGWENTVLDWNVEIKRCQNWSGAGLHYTAACRTAAVHSDTY